jgi:23S rRNA pseudouridine955/2504/2580 synthase
VRLPLHKYLTAEGERRVSVDAEGKAAHSIVRLVARWENFSLVEVELKTGRTHQIRVHLSHLGLPRCGDDKYGDFPLNKALQKQGLGRMFLHAAKLALPHPLRGAAGTRIAAAGGAALLRTHSTGMKQRDYGKTF